MKIRTSQESINFCQKSLIDPRILITLLNRGGGVLMDLAYLFLILALSIFLGFALISRVPPLLHTPLMSEANAISGITLIGALIAAGSEVHSTLSVVLGTASVAFTTYNVLGGYIITERMLKMFKKKDQK